MLSQEVAQRKEAEEQLETLLATIQRNHDDLIAILNQWRIGTALTDSEGKVTFFSQAAQQLCGKMIFSSVGELWQRLFGESSYQTQIEEMVSRDPKEREKVLVRMASCRRRIHSLGERGCEG